MSLLYFSHLMRKPGLRTGQTQTELYMHRRWLEAGNVGFRKKRNCTICVAKTKGLITAKLIFAFFTYAKCWFSHVAAHFSVEKEIESFSGHTQHQCILLNCAFIHTCYPGTIDEN